jgi:hypothetical protein
MKLPTPVRLLSAEIGELCDLFRDPDVVEQLMKRNAAARLELAKLAARLIAHDSGWMLAGHATADDLPLWILRTLVADFTAADGQAESPRTVAHALERARAAGAKRGRQLLAGALRKKPSAAARAKMSAGARKAARRRARGADGSFAPAAGRQGARDANEDTTTE